MHYDLDDYDCLVPKSTNKSKSYSADKHKNIQEERILEKKQKESYKRQTEEQTMRLTHRHINRYLDRQTDKTSFYTFQTSNHSLEIVAEIHKKRHGSDKWEFK